MLRDFPGAILSVSHDRKFMEEVCDRVLVLTPQGLKETR
jgi:ATPase subunit of ABC transporter with duplicated ATPase domains